MSTSATHYVILGFRFRNPELTVTPHITDGGVLSALEEACDRAVGLNLKNKVVHGLLIDGMCGEYAVLGQILAVAEENAGLDLSYLINEDRFTRALDEVRALVDETELDLDLGAAGLHVITHFH